MSTVLDDFSRYILAWKLCTTMTATDVSDTLDVALKAVGLKQVRVRHRPRLLSDNGPSYVSGELAKWLEAQGMAHTRGRPYHLMTQGKIERWHRSLKNQILLDNYYMPGHLEQRIGRFVAHYNRRRYHESLNNLTPEDVYLGRGQTILNAREKSNARPWKADGVCIDRPWLLNIKQRSQTLSRSRPQHVQIFLTTYSEPANVAIRRAPLLARSPPASNHFSNGQSGCILNRQADPGIQRRLRRHAGSDAVMFLARCNAGSATAASTIPR